MKTLILLTSFLFSFQLSNAQNVSRLLGGSEMYLISRSYKDSIVYHFKDYAITVSRCPNTNECIKIVDSKKRITLFPGELATYFYGIIDNKMIIDVGTSNIREFKVYDLNNMNMIFSSDYCNEISANCKTIRFEYPFDPSQEPFEKPDCPDKKKYEKWGGSAGYVEPREYKVDSNELIKSGNIRCEYFE